MANIKCLWMMLPPQECCNTVLRIGRDQNNLCQNDINDDMHNMTLSIDSNRTVFCAFLSWMRQQFSEWNKKAIRRVHIHGSLFNVLTQKSLSGARSLRSKPSYDYYYGVTGTTSIYCSLELLSSSASSLPVPTASTSCERTNVCGTGVRDTFIVYLALAFWSLFLFERIFLCFCFSVFATPNKWIRAKQLVRTHRFVCVLLFVSSRTNEWMERSSWCYCFCFGSHRIVSCERNVECDVIRDRDATTKSHWRAFFCPWPWFRS